MKKEGSSGGKADGGKKKKIVSGDGRKEQMGLLPR